jgi:phosphohistidine swiveling domain-containing protein/uncharacterized membrane-anchored protein YhcB (DUF1043 family)
MTDKTLKPLLNSKKELLVWGPVPGVFYHGSMFAEAFARSYGEKNEWRWPDSIVLFRKNNILWINEYPTLRKTGREVFLRYVLPRDERRKMKKKWKEAVGVVVAMHSEINKEKLRELSDEALKQLIKKYSEACGDFMTLTIAPELGNYGSEELLEEKLSESIKDTNERSLVMEILTSPEELSFNQQEEIDLAETDNVEKHQQKYFWINNGYGGAIILPVEFFVERKKELGKDVKKKVKGRLKEVKENKKLVDKKHELSLEIMDIAEGISDAIVWQDERKMYIHLFVHYQRLLLDEAARRSGYKTKDLLNAWYHEVVEIIDGKDLSAVLKNRHDGFGIEFDEISLRELLAQKVKDYWKLYQHIEISNEADKVDGVVASRGQKKIKGKVRILLDPFDVESFKDGEILVAPMTSPEYVFAMRKAAAIVTDRGGLTSHAAIVSRELSIPCILNTKVASKVFRDGDLVEVDTDKGVVKKL